MNLISIKEAATQRIDRLRQPQWIQPEDHIKLDLVNGSLGPWIHLYAPFNEECNGRDPVDILGVGYDLTQKSWLPYTGVMPDSDEYKAAQAKFKGGLQ